LDALMREPQSEEELYVALRIWVRARMREGAHLSSLQAALARVADELAAVELDIWLTTRGQPSPT
jgi:hypothetical protein